MLADDQDLKHVYAMLAEGKIDAAAAEAAETALYARRRRREGNDPSQPSKPPAGRCGASRRREKAQGREVMEIFPLGRIVEPFNAPILE